MEPYPGLIPRRPSPTMESPLSSKIAFLGNENNEDAGPDSLTISVGKTSNLRLGTDALIVTGMQAEVAATPSEKPLRNL